MNGREVQLVCESLRANAKGLRLESRRRGLDGEAWAGRRAELREIAQACEELAGRIEGRTMADAVQDALRVLELARRRREDAVAGRRRTG